MFLDELLGQLKDLPYDEQQLFFKLNELILQVYSCRSKSLGRENAIEMLKGVLSSVQESIGVIDDSNDISKNK